MERCRVSADQYPPGSLGGCDLSRICGLCDRRRVYRRRSQQDALLLLYGRGRGRAGLQSGDQLHRRYRPEHDLHSAPAVAVLWWWRIALFGDFPADGDDGFDVRISRRQHVRGMAEQLVQGAGLLGRGFRSVQLFRLRQLFPADQYPEPDDQRRHGVGVVRHARSVADHRRQGADPVGRGHQHQRQHLGRPEQRLFRQDRHQRAEPHQLVQERRGPAGCRQGGCGGRKIYRSDGLRVVG